MSASRGHDSAVRPRRPVSPSSRCGAGELDTPQWIETRKTLFQDRPIQEAADAVVQLDVPLRPDDAAAVPVLIKVKAAQARERFVKNLYIVIDRNPEPLAGVFHLTPDSGLAEMQTRLRVETHSPMRAIAEMNDGKLYMAAKLVKAAGGCAAPPVMVHRAAEHGADPGPRPGQAGAQRAQLGASSSSCTPTTPASSVTRSTPLPISAHYVTDVGVTFDGRPVLTARDHHRDERRSRLPLLLRPDGPGS